MIVLIDLKIELIEKKNFERLKSFRPKRGRSKVLPVKTLASEAPEGHVTTANFSTDKISRAFFSQAH
jgi:hypothetical protein